MDDNTIPEVLRAARQWVVWRLETRNGKSTKVPYTVTGNLAKTTDASTWTDYATARAAQGYTGVGYVFAGDGIAGIDFDNCLADGRLKPWTAAVLSRCPSYAEKSPSGNGVKLWVRGTLRGHTGHRKGYRDGAVEVYDRARFFTVTGDRLDGHIDVADGQAVIDWLLSTVFAESTPKPAPPPPPASDPNDDAIIASLLDERSGKAVRLWHGDIGGYVSASEADAALCCKIAWYTNDPARVERIFNQSCLVRDKWAARADYRRLTIESAIAKSSTRQRYDALLAGKRITVQPPPANAAPPMPADASDLKRVIDATLSGKRRNEPWGPWRMLTKGARALMPGSSTVLCGSGGSSKSLFVSDSCLYWLDNSTPFAVYHLEEDRAHHLHRALAQLSGNSKLTDDEWMRDNPDVVTEAYAQHEATLHALGAAISDAPNSEASLADVLAWIRQKAQAGARLIVVDPITAADSGPEPWTEDKRFVNEAKKILRLHEASLICVTHPRGGKPIAGEQHLDNLAGGRAWGRFVQCVLWMAHREDDEPASVKDAGMLTTNQPVNRVLKVLKTRNGIGSGWNIGFLFDPSTLRFSEQGVLQDRR